MATVRSGNQAALLVVDVQVGIVASAWNREKVIGNIDLAVSRAREAGVPVIWVQHHDDELQQGSDAWRWVEELQPRSDEPLIHKRYNSAFEQTGLEAELARRGVTHIVLAGAMTNWCIRSTAHGALDRGYDLTLLKDAHTTEDLRLSEGRVISARDMVTELNAAIRWLAYPDRVNTVAHAADVELGAPGHV
ncbi:cysteine hydrolase family protein [Dyella jiangningensis]|uniref:cysteine hydrolase family protein n=1 Tax=Dyella jiangningensis TaxID=1379159 RepID=UPI00240F349F|nr:cysteine hydrolase family protein [Dyella jiangningensis]MDG2536920.1 cysteine hydrolase family protein [Dyella jiangningensis]